MKKNKYLNNFLLILFASIPSFSICILSYYSFPIVDLKVYDDKFIEAAKQILHIGFYSDNWYLPLYPYLLSIFFKFFGINTFYPILFNAFFHGLTSFLLAKIAKNFNTKWFYPTLILASCLPHLIWRTTYVYAETLFILLLVSSLFFLFVYLDKKKLIYLILSSFFLGLSFITKASNILVAFILPFFLFFLFYKKISHNYISSLKLVFLYSFIFIFILSFQFQRIHKETGYYGYSYQTGGRLLYYMYPCLLSKFGCGKKNQIAADKARALDDPIKRDIEYSKIMNPYYLNIQEKEIAIKLIKEIDLLTIISSSVGGYIKLFFHNFTYEVFDRLHLSSIHLSEFSGGLFTKIKLMLQKIFQEANFMFFWLISELFLFLSRIIQTIGLFYFFSIKKKVYEFILLLVFFVPSLIPVISLGSIRYRVPVEPLLIILTISGLSFIYNYCKNKRIKN